MTAEVLAEEWAQLRREVSRPPRRVRKVREAFPLRHATRYGSFDASSDVVTARWIDRALADAFGQTQAPWAPSSLPETLRATWC